MVALNSASTSPQTGTEPHFRVGFHPKKAWKPKVHESYDVPVKTRKKKCRLGQFGQFEEIPTSPQLIARFPRLVVLEKLRLSESSPSLPLWKIPLLPEGITNMK